MPSPSAGGILTALLQLVQPLGFQSGVGPLDLVPLRNQPGSRRKLRPRHAAALRRGAAPLDVIPLPAPRLGHARQVGGPLQVAIVQRRPARPRGAAASRRLRSSLPGAAGLRARSLSVTVTLGGRAGAAPWQALAGR